MRRPSFTVCIPTSARSTRCTHGSSSPALQTSSGSTVSRTNRGSSATSWPAMWPTTACRSRCAHCCTTVSAYLESEGPQAIERNLDLLAYHYWLGEDPAKKREFAVRAGIAAQARYANDAAADYLQRALPLVPDDERAGVLRRLGKVLELRGGWADAEATYREAIELSLSVGDDQGKRERTPTSPSRCASRVASKMPANNWRWRARSSRASTMTRASGSYFICRARSHRSKVSTTGPTRLRAEPADPRTPRRASKRWQPVEQPRTGCRERGRPGAGTHDERAGPRHSRRGR